MLIKNKSILVAKFFVSMPFVLKNNTIEIHIDAPHENYQQARFDWSSKIVLLKYKGVAVFASEKLAQPQAVNFGKAFYNEFGIDTALGFSEAMIGGAFHKIGVGILKKTTATYDFMHAYEITPCKFSYSSEDNRYVSQCIPPLVNGYAYELKKEVKLLEKGFKINYELVNTGNKTIITDEYCHNFLAVNNQLLGEGYLLSFPFELVTDKFNDFLNPDDVVSFSKNDISFKDTPKNDIFFSNVTGGKISDASWQLFNSNAGIGIRETCSFKTDKINVWGCAHVISPELFFKIHVEPGKKISWNRAFSLFDNI